MTNIIKCRFLDKDGEPRGREYSYKTEIPVEVGQIVDVPAPIILGFLRSSCVID